jgi:hypothetical protein
MKTFEIQYVGRFGFDNKEYYSEIIKAKTEKSALNKFAKIHNIKANDIISTSWWDNNWLMEFRNIKEITEHTCPHCNGTGKIIIENATK